MSAFASRARASSAVRRVSPLLLSLSDGGSRASSAVRRVSPLLFSLSHGGSQVHADVCGRRQAPLLRVCVRGGGEYLDAADGGVCRDAANPLEGTKGVRTRKDRPLRQTGEHAIPHARARDAQA
eukprot:4680731-Pleurochrysis_carterae.AAC.1